MCVVKCLTLMIYGRSIRKLIAPNPNDDTLLTACTEAHTAVSRKVVFY